METTYKPEYLKTLSVKTDKDFNCDVVENLGDEYKVYNFNCYYDFRNPEEFLNYLLSLVFQYQSYKLENNVLTINNKFCCNFIIQKRHILVVSPYTHTELDITYGSTRNNLTLLKLFFRIAQHAHTAERIKALQISRFKIIHVERNKEHYWNKLNVVKPNYLIIHIEDCDMNKEFIVHYNFNNNVFRFVCYVNEGGYYESEQLTTVELQRKINLYTQLLDQVSFLQEYWDTFQLVTKSA